VFLTLMVIGLVGLLVMAIPAFGRLGHGHGHGAGPALHQGHGGHGHGGAGALGRGGAGGMGRGGMVTVPRAGTAPTGPAANNQELVPADTAPSGLLRFVPSPRAVLSVLALYGAFGNALLEAAHLPFVMAVFLAAVPALLIERILVRPLWNLLFRFQGQPSSSLDALLYAEACAVVPFKNGRGLVSVERDGRLVQLSARLRADQAALPIKVGERLRVEDVDARRERVTVSVFRD
jgi:hypothetical protein